LPTTTTLAINQGDHSTLSIKRIPSLQLNHNIAIMQSKNQLVSLLLAFALILVANATNLKVRHDGDHNSTYSAPSETTVIISSPTIVGEASISSANYLLSATGLAESAFTSATGEVGSAFVSATSYAGSVLSSATEAAGSIVSVVSSDASSVEVSASSAIASITSAAQSAVSSVKSDISSALASSVSSSARPSASLAVSRGDRVRENGVGCLVVTFFVVNFVTMVFSL
jgi:hypothetical protein